MPAVFDFKMHVHFSPSKLLKSCAQILIASITRSTDFIFGWNIKNLSIIAVTIKGEVCYENLPWGPNVLLWFMVKIAIIGSDMQVYKYSYLYFLN